MSNNIQTSLRQQVTLLSWREQIVGCFLIGGFAFLFLLFFQPFGVNNYDPQETITAQFFFIMLLIGVYISLVLLFNQLVLFRVFIKEPVRRWQIVLWVVWTMVYTSSCVFLLYNVLGEWHDFRLRSWLEFIGNFSVLGILPLAALWYYSHVKTLKSALTQTNQSYDRDGAFVVRLTSENAKEILNLKLSDLLYLASDDNYVAVHYLTETGPKKKLLRNTIKSVDELALHPALYRCHRSYLINLYHLKHFKGTTQQGQLELEQVDTPIAVSRRYIQALRDQLN